jgi:ferredoxin
MAITITEERLNCGACKPESPNNSIYEGGAEWRYSDCKALEGFLYCTKLKNTVGVDESHTPLSMDLYFIVTDKYTECIGYHDELQCAALCPVDCHRQSRME